MKNKSLKQIVIVVGNSASGKSTLSKMLGEYYNSEVLGFSYAGRLLSAEKKDSSKFLEINDYIYSCIIAGIARNDVLVIDGLASDYILNKLKKHYVVIVLCLITSYENRIQRMSIREHCTIEEAALIERKKEEGKAKAGLEKVILEADCFIDCTKSSEKVFLEAISFLKSKI